MSGPNGYWKTQNSNEILLVIKMGDNLYVFKSIIRNNRFVINDDQFHLSSHVSHPNLWADIDGMVVIYNEEKDQLMFYHDEVEAPAQWRSRVNEDDLPSTMCKNDDIGIIDFPPLYALPNESTLDRLKEEGKEYDPGLHSGWGNLPPLDEEPKGEPPLLSFEGYTRDTQQHEDLLHRCDTHYYDGEEVPRGLTAYTRT